MVTGCTRRGELGKTTSEENRLEERLAEPRARKSTQHPRPTDGKRNERATNQLNQLGYTVTLNPRETAA